VAVRTLERNSTGFTRCVTEVGLERSAKCSVRPVDSLLSGLGYLDFAGTKHVGSDRKAPSREIAQRQLANRNREPLREDRARHGTDVGERSHVPISFGRRMHRAERSPDTLLPRPPSQPRLVGRAFAHVREIRMTNRSIRREIIGEFASCDIPALAHLLSRRRHCVQLDRLPRRQ